MAEQFDIANCKVALLAGGRSSEREISLASGEGAREALVEAGFDVTMLDPASSDDLKTLIDGGFDVAFLTTHGRLGEDGALQGFLELIGLPYTGSDIWAAATAMNKARAKDVYSIAGIKTPAYLTLLKGEAYDAAEIIAKTGAHCVVKAACEGSTLGLYVCTKEEELTEAIEKAFTFDDTVVVESFITGDEFTVAVTGGREPMALPVIQIVAASGFYDYEAKYTPGGSTHLCPAPISEELTKKMQVIAVEAHEALGCYGVSRTDFIVDAEGECWVLETNTLPGMTKTSLLPDAARAMGISFDQVCANQVRYALERAGRL